MGIGSSMVGFVFFASVCGHWIVVRGHSLILSL